MGLFEHWPYTNFHDLNLDWIIKKIPEVFTASAQAVQSAETAVSSKNDAVAAKESAQLSAENAASSEESAGQSAESAQNYAEHIADPVGGLVTGWLDDNITPTTPPVDASLTVQGAAADAKATGDSINNLRVLIDQGLPYEVKIAIDEVCQNVAFKNNDGYSNSLSVIHNWATNIELLSINAVYTQTGPVYDIDSLEDLRTDLVVTAVYANGTTAPVINYFLSGDLEPGTSIITVTYAGKTTTFNVTVTEASRDMIFGTFTNGYSVSKKMQASAGGDLPMYAIWNAQTAGRASITVPIRNRGYILTVTDTSKYAVAVYDVVNNTPIETDYANAVLGRYYAGGTKAVAWETQDSAESAYIMVALRKNDNTAFTNAELANGAEAVFTYTAG